MILKESKSWGEKKEERKLDTSRKRYTRRYHRRANKAFSSRMVADILIPPTLNEKSRNVQPVSPQPQPHNNNNLSLLVDRESSILKLNRFEFGII